MCTSNLASTWTTGLSPSEMPTVIVSLPSPDVSTTLAVQPLAPLHIELLQAPTSTLKQVMPKFVFCGGTQMPLFRLPPTRFVIAPSSLSMPGLVTRACRPPSIT